MAPTCPSNLAVGQPGSKPHGWSRDTSMGGSPNDPKLYEFMIAHIWFMNVYDTMLDDSPCLVGSLSWQSISGWKWIAVIARQHRCDGSPFFSDVGENYPVNTGGWLMIFAPYHHWITQPWCQLWHARYSIRVPMIVSVHSTIMSIWWMSSQQKSNRCDFLTTSIYYPLVVSDICLGEI